jgi:hypothetical protein
VNFKRKSNSLCNFELTSLILRYKYQYFAKSQNPAMRPLKNRSPGMTAFDNHHPPGFPPFARPLLRQLLVYRQGCDRIASTSRIGWKASLSVCNARCYPPPAIRGLARTKLFCELERRRAAPAEGVNLDEFSCERAASKTETAQVSIIAAAFLLILHHTAPLPLQLRHLRRVPP